MRALSSRQTSYSLPDNDTMPQLTDLPDELLLQILAYTLPIDHTGGGSPHLANHIICHRFYNLSHQAFFESYIYRITIIQDTKEWDQGTLLCDIYSPTFSKRGSVESCLEIIANVQRLELNVLVHLEGGGQTFMDRVVGECLREMRRYSKLKTVYLSAVRESQRLLTDKLTEAVPRDPLLSGVKFAELC